MEPVPAKLSQRTVKPSSTTNQNVGDDQQRHQLFVVRRVPLRTDASHATSDNYPSISRRLSHENVKDLRELLSKIGNNYVPETNEQIRSISFIYLS